MLTKPSGLRKKDKCTTVNIEPSLSTGGGWDGMHNQCTCFSVANNGPVIKDRGRQINCRRDDKLCPLSRRQYTDRTEYANNHMIQQKDFSPTFAENSDQYY